MKSRSAVCMAFVVAWTLAVGARPAWAQGVMNIGWDDCGAAGVANRTFACDTNAGSATIYVSGISPIPLPSFNGAGANIDLQTNLPSLSPWWRFASGGCRADSSLSASADFTGETACLDPYPGSSSAGVTYYEEYNGPGTATIRFACFSGAGTSSISATDEYYFARIRIDFEKSTGTGSCPGCLDPVCFVLPALNLGQPGGGADGYITITTPGIRQYVKWQSADDSSTGCFLYTPVRATTWGAVKSLYR